MKKKYYRAGACVLGCFLLLAGCSTNDNHNNESVTPTETEHVESNTEISNVANMGCEKTYVLDDSNFQEIILNNPIDESREIDNDSTLSMVESAKAYADAWEAEIENALNILEDYLLPEDYDALVASYAEWDAYVDNMNSLEKSIFYSDRSEYEGPDEKIAAGTYLVPSVEEVRALRLKEYAIEIMSLEYAFTGNVQFVYEQNDLPKYLQAEMLVRDEIWEIGDWSAWVTKKTNGEAYMVWEAISDSPQEIYKHENPQEPVYYYLIFVGEKWEDRAPKWEWFCVSENLDEILWYDFAEGEAYPLEKWRASDRYQEKMQEMKEFLSAEE